MAGLTAGRNTPEVADSAKFLILPVDAEAVIHEGGLVVLDASGNAKAAVLAASLTAAGRAEEFVDNTGGIAGAKTVKVRRGTFVWNNSVSHAVTKAHVLKDCYIEDDNTVSSLATGSSRAGTVIGVTDDGVLVETPKVSIPAMALTDLTGVTLTSPSNGQVLKFNGTAWVNGTDAVT